MVSSKHSLIATLSTIACTLCVPTVAICSDQLVAATNKVRFEQYEPIVVHVVLELEEPFFVSPTDPTVRTSQELNLRRRFVLEVLDDSALVASARLWGGGFALLEDGQTKYSATLFGCLGKELHDNVRSQFVFFQRTGEFMAVVRDLDWGIKSNAMAITISPASAEKPAELFRDGGLDTLALLLGKDSGDTMLPVFRTLSEQWSDTVYGRYAQTSLAFREYARARMARPIYETLDKREALIENLERTLDLFAPGHPNRNRALLALATLGSGRQSKREPRKPIRKLLEESRDGAYIRKARELELQLENQ